MFSICLSCFVPTRKSVDHLTEPDKMCQVIEII